MLKWKINVLKALKEKGLSTYTIRKDNLLSQSTIQKINHQNGVSWENIDRICKLLECQPGDILEYVDD